MINQLSLQPLRVNFDYIFRDETGEKIVMALSRDHPKSFILYRNDHLKR